ncbi:MAG: DUF169 domain-containing protein [Candidatus Bathyarchaeia archaeon]
MGKGMDPELDWASCSQRLKEVLGLRGSPVAIAYSNTPAPGASGGIYRACGAILAARDGEAINLASDNCGCKGGIYHLGLGPPREGLEAFLAYEERLFSSLTVARRMIQGMRREAPPPFGLAKFVVFSPLERIESKPDWFCSHATPSKPAGSWPWPASMMVHCPRRTSAAPYAGALSRIP